MKGDRARGDELLDELRHVEVVGVGLVGLEHRELGVVAGRDPLVAEDPADLKDTLEAPDHEALQIELGRDPQREVGVQRVVVGEEGLGVGPSGERLQHRRLDLDEAERVEDAPQVAHGRGARKERLARALVRPQVDLPLAVAELGVLHPPPLVTETDLARGEQHPARDEHRELAAAGAHDFAVCADPVAEVEAGEGVELLGSPLLGEELDGTGPVAQLREGEAPLRAAQHDPAGDARLLAGGFTGGEVLVPGSEAPCGDGPRETVGRGTRAAAHSASPLAPPLPSAPLVLRAHSSRSPCSVSQGSWWSTTVV